MTRHAIHDELLKRLREKRRFVQILARSRQAGKTPHGPGPALGLTFMVKLNPSLSLPVPKAFALSNSIRSRWFKTLLVGAVLPILAGCVERQVVYRDRPVYVQAPPPGSPPPVEVVVDEPPMPPPQVEYITPAPDPSFVWIGGSWEWRGRWVWAGGRWGHPPHSGAVWGRGHWRNHGGGRVWVSAGWH